MIDVATRFTYSDTPKPTLKHASKKARRRQDTAEVTDALLASTTDTTIELTAFERDCSTPTPQQVAAALLIWDSGLDYNMDGTPYQDDAPGHFPHSFHHSHKDAEVEAAWLINAGLDPWRVEIVENFWVPEWLQDKIPPR